MTRRIVVVTAALEAPRRRSSGSVETYDPDSLRHLVGHATQSNPIARYAPPRHLSTSTRTSVRSAAQLHSSRLQTTVLFIAA